MFFRFKKNSVSSKDCHQEPQQKDNQRSLDKVVPLLKHNQKCIADKIYNKVEGTEFAADNLIAITSQIAQAVEMQMNSTGKVVDEIGNYSALAQEVFANTESSLEISKGTVVVAQNGNEAVNDSIQAMKEIRESVDTAKHVVNVLKSKAGNIHEMLNVIKDITDSTGLLSLNASIEAARAGEAGRGFAVVAQEVKNLAQRSAESVEYISKMIVEINESIDQSFEAMNSIINKVNLGTDIAAGTAEVFKTIITEVTNNSEVFEEIYSAISKQTTSLEHVIDSAESMSDNTKKLMASAEIASLYTLFVKASLASLTQTSGELKILTAQMLNKLESPPFEGSLLRTCLPNEILSFNPLLSTQHLGSQILSNAHAGLLALDADGQLSPGLAKSWCMEENNTWVFNLRKGAKFHNGREITASDVKYSLERILDPHVKSPHAWSLRYVEGSQEFVNGTAQEVSGIKVLDNYRLSIRLESPYAGFLRNLCYRGCSIIAQEQTPQGGIVGCGPFVLSVGKDECNLAAFPEYFNGEPYVNRIQVRLTSDHVIEDFLNSEYDFIFFEDKSIMEKLRGASNINVSTKNIMGTYYAGFNLESKSSYVKSREARKAINYAVNKRRLIDKLVGELGVESKGPLPPSIIEDPTLAGYSYNPKLAKQMLTQAGLSNCKEPLKILYRQDGGASLFNKITECIVEDLSEIGISCEMVNAPSSNYLKLDTISNSDLFIARWIADTGDPDNFLYPCFSPGLATNRSSYNNELVNQKLDVTKEMINPNKRSEAYKEIQKIIVEDAPWIFLYHPNMGFAYQNNVANIKLTPLGLLRYEDIIMTAD